MALLVGDDGRNILFWLEMIGKDSACLIAVTAGTLIFVCATCRFEHCVVMQNLMGTNIAILTLMRTLANYDLSHYPLIVTS